MVAPGSKILQYKAKGEDNQPVIIFLTPENQYLVVAGNFNGKQQNLRKTGGKIFGGDVAAPFSKYILYKMITRNNPR